MNSRTTHLSSIACAIAIAFSMLAASVQAQETPVPQTATADSDQSPSVEELAKLKQNPVSGLRQIVFQAVVSPEVPVTGKTAGNYSLQPVWPFPLGKDWRLVTYTILPVVQQPGAAGEKTIVGLGDTLINLFVSPRKAKKVVWGAGPAILLPTRTNAALGSDRLSLGPAGLLFYAKGAWSIGLVVQNGWSLGGTGINKLNAFGAQYLINYNLRKAWYLYSNSTISSNWTADQNNRWTVPVGGGVGKIFMAGKLPLSASLQMFANVVTPSGAPTWGANFQFAFLLGAPQ